MPEMGRRLWLYVLLVSVSAACGSGDRPAESGPASERASATGESGELVLFTEQKADGERYGYRTPAGTVVIEPRFRMAEDFSETGLAAVVDESGWAYINTKGEVVVRPFVFDNGPDSFSQGLARFERDEKFGFFDERGQVVIQPRFEFALPFSEGLAAVCKGCTRESHGEHWSAVGGNWGYIDRSGRESIPFAYDDAASFEGGRARVVQDGKPRWIGKDGRPQQ